MKDNSNEYLEQNIQAQPINRLFLQKNLKLYAEYTIITGKLYCYKTMMETSSLQVTFQGENA